MEKRLFICFSFLFVFLLINYVSAGIYFSDLNNKYNLGDMVDFNVKVDPVKEGFLLNAKMYCDSNLVIEFNNLPSADGTVNIKLPLNFNTINRANGNCYFRGDYGGEMRESSNFEISKFLDVKLNNNAFFSNPENEIVISGNAEKMNGNKVNGEVEIRIPLLEHFKDFEGYEKNNSNGSQSDEEQNLGYNYGIFYGKVSDGKFSVNFKIPEDTPAGDFRLDVLVYEKSGEEKSSEGVSYANLKVFQVLRNIELDLNAQNFDPGTIVEIKPKLLDQTGVSMNEEVSIIIKNENKERFYEKIVKSEESLEYIIPKNAPSGYYEIEASSSKIKIFKTFFVNQKAIASFDLINDTLVVTNVGNIIYNRNVEIEINGKPFIKNLNLELGESKSFKLTGSKGNYDVMIRDGVSELSRSRVFLTGRAVNVNNVGDGINFNSPILWIFFFVIMVLLLFFLLRKVFRKKSVAFHSFRKDDMTEKRFSNNLDVIKSVPISNVPPIKKADAKGAMISNKADKVMVMSGDKSKVAVLALKIKNKIGKNEKAILEKAMESIYSKKGAVYEQGEFIFAIFSPLMTRTMSNELVAINAAQNISNSLNEHNKKFREIIDFGIAVNSGEIINKVENGKLKFTALGNFLVGVKRLAESSNKQVLMSKESSQRAGQQVKVDKIEENTYVLRNIVDSEKNSKFIQGFLERQKGK